MNTQAQTHFTSKTSRLAYVREFHPLMLPNPDESNKKAIYCRTCGIKVTAGSAYRWDYTPEAASIMRSAAPDFYCSGCHRHHLGLLDAQAEAHPYLVEIEAWCKNVPLSMASITYDMVERMVRSAGLRQAELAQMIADELSTLGECSYSAAVDVARNSIKRINSIEMDANGGAA